jgi:CheY-like chemotaxis protein
VKSTSRATILFVDDDPCMREVMAIMLEEEGYEVSTAAEGFDALVQLRSSVPDLIISDLYMAGMSGDEFLSVVRRRFPAVPVIAISGAHAMDASFPVGIMADAFYPKGRCHPDELMRTIRRLMHGPLTRPTNYHPCQPPVIQNARISRDSSGRQVLMLICTDCLRAFSFNAAGLVSDGILEAHCSHCHVPVEFSAELPLAPPILPAHEPLRASAA